MKEISRRLGMKLSKVYKWHWDRTELMNKNYQFCTMLPHMIFKVERDEKGVGTETTGRTVTQSFKIFKVVHTGVIDSLISNSQQSI
jgi:hypothetical protein